MGADALVPAGTYYTCDGCAVMGHSQIVLALLARPSPSRANLSAAIHARFYCWVLIISCHTSLLPLGGGTGNVDDLLSVHFS